MIKSFKCDDTRKLFETGKSARFWPIQKVATLELTRLEAAVTLDFLRSPPGNRLEALRGDRGGRHRVHINDKWRLCFRWTEAGAEDVEIVDHH